ncbi:MAG: immunoglobulin-like domain-containing protein [Eubacteriales bacterium]
MKRHMKNIIRMILGTITIMFIVAIPSSAEKEVSEYSFYDDTWDGEGRIGYVDVDKERHTISTTYDVSALRDLIDKGDMYYRFYVKAKSDDDSIYTFVDYSTTTTSDFKRHKETAWERDTNNNYMDIHIAHIKVPEGTKYIKVGMVMDSEDIMMHEIEMIVDQTLFEIYDEISPAISRVYTDDTHLGIGDSGTIYVEFDEKVIVDNTADIGFTLDNWDDSLGDEAKPIAEYYSGSGSKTLAFEYTMQEEHNNSNDVGILSTEIWSSSNVANLITDLSGNPANLSLPDNSQSNSLKQQSDLKVNKDRPVVSNIEISNATRDTSKNIGINEESEIKVYFDKPVSVPSNTKLTLSNGQTASYYNQPSNDTAIYRYKVSENDEQIEGLQVTGINNWQYITSTDVYENLLDEPILPKPTNSDIIIDSKKPTVDIYGSVPTNYKYSITEDDNIRYKITDDFTSVVSAEYMWSDSSNIPSKDDVRWETAVTGIEKYIELPDSKFSNYNTGTFYLHFKSIDSANNISFDSPLSVKVDQLEPTINFEPDGNLSSDISHDVSISATDEHSSVKDIEYRIYKVGTEGDIEIKSWTSINNGETISVNNYNQDGTFNSDNSGDYYIQVRALDYAGNENIKSSEKYILDYTGPQVEIEPNEVLECEKNHSPNVLITDNGIIDSVEYIWSYNPIKPTEDANWELALSDVNKVTEETNITSPNTLTGEIYLHIRATDSLGNSSYTTSSEFMVDNTAPNISIGTNGSNNPARSVSSTVEVEDYEDNTDVKSYYLWSQNEIESEENITQAFTSGERLELNSGDGKYYLHIKAVDRFGNQRVNSSDYFILDNTPPTGDIDIIDTITNKVSTAMDLSATDEYSDIYYRYKINDGSWIDWNNYIGQTNIDLPDVDGTHTVEVQFKDALNNMSEILEDSIILDTEPPLATPSYSHKKGELTNEDVIVTLELTDDNTSQEELNNINTTSYTFEENGDYRFAFEDKAGNEEYLDITVDWIDKEPPTGTMEYDINTPTRDNVLGTINVDDNNGESVTILNNSGEPTYLFDKPDEKFTFELMDSVGNTSSVEAVVTWIDREPPIGEITLSTEKRTADPVIATLSANEPIIVTNNNGSFEKEFTENGSFEFEYMDEAGNEATSEVVVTNIDDTLPRADITYSTTEWTKEDVEVTISVMDYDTVAIHQYPENFLLEDDIVYDDNGNIKEIKYLVNENETIMEIELIDIDTHLTTVTNAYVDFLDNEPPYISNIIYSEEEWTQNNVTVNVEIKDELSDYTIINNEGSHTLEFTENGVQELIVEDSLGNRDTLDIEVNNIDREEPTATIEYSTQNPTNQPVIASIAIEDNSKDTIIVTNNEGSLDREFLENGDFTFEFEDMAGNKATEVAEVTWIDLDAPKYTYEFSTTEPTRDNVNVTFEFDDESGNEVVLKTQEGEICDNDTYIFEENEEVVFLVEDAAGNIDEVPLEVDWIDREAPELYVEYNYETTVNKPVMAYLEVEDKNDYLITNNLGSKEYRFTDNGSFTWYVEDALGNKNSITATVDWIDSTPPDAWLSYSTTEATTEVVEVTVESDEEIMILNNNQKANKYFYENGTYNFSVSDKAGNVIELLAEVNNIDTTPPRVSLEYSETEITNKDVTVTIDANEEINVINNDNKKHYTFTENGEYHFVVEDVVGNRVIVKAEVNNIDKEAPKIELHRGDTIILMEEEDLVLDDYIVTDNIDVNLNDQVTIEHSINTDLAGDYIVTYSVEDRAGNKATKTRLVKVITSDSLNTFVNGEYPSEEGVILDNNRVVFNITGALGVVDIKASKGYKTFGNMKRATHYLDENIYNAPETGWYTFFIQDQERNGQLIRVFIDKVQ